MRRVVFAAALIAALGTGCAGRREAAAGVGPAEPSGPVAAAALPGLVDLVRGREVFFTRRLAPSGETVAFRFTPAEVTSRGRVIGDLAFEGRQASGRADAVAAEIGFDRTPGAGCGRVTLSFEPVALPGLVPAAALEPVSVDLRRAGTMGRAAAVLCEGAGDLVAALRDLGSRLDELLPRQ